MMIKFQRVFTLAIGWIVLSAPVASAGVDLVGTGTYSIATPGGGIGLGGGLGYGFRLGKMVELDLRGLYLTRQYSSTNQIGMLEPQLGLGIFLSRSLAVDLGGYFNYYLTNPQSLTGKDYGAFGGLRLIIPLGARSGLLLGGQYHYALSQVSNGTTSTASHEVILLVGLTFGGGMKDGH